MRILDLQLFSWISKLPIGQVIITARVLQKILSLCGNSLTDISFGQDVPNMYIRKKLLITANKDFFSSITKDCLNLQSLDVSGLTLTSNGMRALLDSCSNITKFSIGFCEANVEKYIPTFLKNATKLQYFGLRGTNISSECLTTADHNSIETLELNGFPKEINLSLFKNLGNIFQHLSNLQTLIIDFCRSSEEDCPNILKPIALHTNNLKKLVLKSEDYRSYFYFKPKYIYGLRNLQELRLVQTTNISNKSLIALANNCRELKKIAVFSLDIRNSSAIKILQLPKLEHLELHNLYFVSDEVLIHATNLKTLRMSHCHSMTNKYLEILLELSLNLETLYISFCDEIETKKLVNCAVSKIKSKRRSGKPLSLYIKSEDTGVYKSIKRVEQLSPYLIVTDMNIKY